jgi:flagellar hook assembly protein FlgD
VGFELPAAGAGRLDLYTIDGRHVRALVHGSLAAGPRRVLWDGRDATGQSVAAGVYLLRLQAGERERRQKLVVTR